MDKISKKVLDRFAATLKNFQAVATSHRARDVSEADTVTLVKDILSDTFGYDKYLELTSEQQIRGVFCDLAVKIDGKIKYLIEVKAAAIELNATHLRQAIQYGATEGIEWVVLTNATDWQLYRIKFGQPVDYEEVASFSLQSMNLKNIEDVKKLFLLCREGLTTDAMDAYHQQALLLNRYTIAQIIASEGTTAHIRKELRRLFPDLKVDVEQVADIVFNEVLKREVVEGDRVKEAQSRVKRAASKLAREAEKRSPKGAPTEPTKLQAAESHGAAGTLPKA